MNKKRIFRCLLTALLLILGSSAKASVGDKVVLHFASDDSLVVIAYKDSVQDTVVEATDTVKETVVEATDSVEPVVIKEVGEVLQMPVDLRERRPLYLALRTNTLFDLAAVPNISGEWSFAPHWSALGEYLHAWWKCDHRHRYWRTYGGHAELRYWLGAHRLRGHHVGVYGGMVTYDFEWGGRGYLARHWSKNVGASYGCSLPLAKRLNLDLELGVGYFTGKYEEYVPKSKFYFWQVTKNRTWVGPTRLEASLVWLIGHKNTNEK